MIRVRLSAGGLVNILATHPSYGGYGIEVCTSGCGPEGPGSLPGSRPMPQKKSVLRTCAKCATDFFVRPVDVKRGLGVFCSRSCKARTQCQLTSGSREANPNWKGGLTRSSKGYWYVKKSEHHRASKEGYVKRADLVLEAKLGRSLRRGEIAHHKNLDKEDDSPDNLELTTLHEHGNLHRFAEEKERKPDHPANRRYAWPPDAELLKMAESRTLREIAASIGCSWSAVGRRLKKIRNSL